MHVFFSKIFNKLVIDLVVSALASQVRGSDFNPCEGH